MIHQLIHPFSIAIFCSTWSLDEHLAASAPELVVILLEGRSNQSTLPCHHGPFLGRGLACANASDQFPELDRHGKKKNDDDNETKALKLTAF